MLNSDAFPCGVRFCYTISRLSVDYLHPTIRPFVQLFTGLTNYSASHLASQGQVHAAYRTDSGFPEVPPSCPLARGLCTFRSGIHWAVCRRLVVWQHWGESFPLWSLELVRATVTLEKNKGAKNGAKSYKGNNVKNDEYSRIISGNK